MLRTTGKSRDHLASSYTVFLIWWYFVRKQYFQVFYVVIISNIYYICHILLI